MNKIDFSSELKTPLWHIAFREFLRRGYHTPFGAAHQPHSIVDYVRLNLISLDKNQSIRKIRQ